MHHGKVAKRGERGRKFVTKGLVYTKLAFETVAFRGRFARNSPPFDRERLARATQLLPNSSLNAKPTLPSAFPPSCWLPTQ